MKSNESTYTEYQNWLVDVHKQATEMSKALADEALKCETVGQAYKYLADRKPHPDGSYGGTTQGAINGLALNVFEDAQSIVRRRVQKVKLHGGN